MVIREVQNTKDAKEFLLFPVRLYRDTPQWIRPLDDDINKVFDKKLNSAFAQGECVRFLLSDHTGKTIGRVATFLIKKLVNKGNDQPTGGIGFFECINDQKVAFLLFDECKKWLMERGMEAMDGPINFGTRDRWWGLLVEGFDKEPNYQCNYHLPYYRDFFEAYGFKLYFNQYTYARDLTDPPLPKLEYKASQVAKDKNYSFRHLTKQDLVKLPEYIKTVYNGAWANRRDIQELSLAQAKFLVKQMNPIIDLQLLWFGFFKDEPIAFFISIPEINQIFKHVNGKMNLVGKLKFLWYKWAKKNKKALGVLFGVVPEHQGIGVDGAIVIASRPLLQSKNFPYKEYEMNWIGDFNPKMIQTVEQVNVKLSKRHITYRKLFDDTKPFRRHPFLH